MPNLAEHRILRLVTLTALYVAQGVPWGFGTVGYVVLLTDMGVDNTAIGVAVGLSYLPWSFKVAWGPLLDAVPPLRIGRRRPFIVGAELLMGAALLALLWIDPRESMHTVTVLLFVINTCASLQDVATDALAIDVLEERERGFANSLMWAGKSLGVVIGGGGGVLLAKLAGWSAVFATMAAIVWTIMLLPLCLRERPACPADRRVHLGLLRLCWFLIPLASVGAIMYLLSLAEERFADVWWVVLIPVAQPFLAVLGAIAAWPLVDSAGFAALRRSFSFALPWWGVAVGVLTPAGYGLIQTVWTRTLRAGLHVSDEGIATLTGVVEPVSGVVGALIGGLLADRLGARRAIAICLGGIAACLATTALSRPLWPEWTYLIAWTAAYNLSLYAYNAASLGMYMSISNPAIGATHFAIYMASTNLTYAFTAPLGGIMADAWGVAPLFAVAAAIQVVTIATLVPLDTGRNKLETSSREPCC